MIASLKGMVADIGQDTAIIEVAGVGYLVQVSQRTAGQLQVDAPVFLHIDTQVREDAITLFGFASRGEQTWFRHLNSVQGVGGRVALAILSTLTGEELAHAIATGDKAMVARSNGVGPKLATRIISELKSLGAGLPTGSSTPFTASSPASPVREAASALENLGFRTAEAERAVGEAVRELGEGAVVGDLIRVALRHASR